MTARLDEALLGFWTATNQVLPHQPLALQKQVRRAATAVSHAATDKQQSNASFDSAGSAAYASAASPGGARSSFITAARSGAHGAPASPGTSAGADRGDVDFSFDTNFMVGLGVRAERRAGDAAGKAALVTPFSCGSTAASGTGAAAGCGGGGGGGGGATSDSPQCA